MSDLAARASAYAAAALAAAADPEKAAPMQAYLKTDMPFYGVQKPGRTPILRALVAEFPPADRDAYEELVLALWSMPHREEKYLAVGVAVRHQRFVVPASLLLYRQLIVEGAWWDLVDGVATQLVQTLVIEYPSKMWPEVDRWITEENMWLRRSAIICQVGAKTATDVGRLFRFCETCAGEEEFFIRKAIGWALREYAKTDPNAVADFVASHRDALSGLSFREATKHIRHLVTP